MSKPEAHCEVCGGPCVASGPLRREAAAARDKVSQLEAENTRSQADYYKPCDEFHKLEAENAALNADIEDQRNRIIQLAAHHERLRVGIRLALLDIQDGAHARASKELQDALNESQ